MKLRKQINREELRNLCIRKDYYNCGDCREYEGLFNMLSDNMTDDDIVAVALNIYYHTDYEEIAKEYGVSYDDVLRNMVFEVFEITHTFVAE